MLLNLSLAVVVGSILISGSAYSANKCVDQFGHDPRIGIVNLKSSQTEQAKLLSDFRLQMIEPAVFSVVKPKGVGWTLKDSNGFEIVDLASLRMAFSEGNLGPKLGFDFLKSEKVALKITEDTVESSMFVPNHKKLNDVLRKFVGSKEFQHGKFTSLSMELRSEMRTPLEQLEYFREAQKLRLSIHNNTHLSNLTNVYFNFLLPVSYTKRVHRIADVWMGLRAELIRESGVVNKTKDISWVSGKPNGPQLKQIKSPYTLKELEAMDRIILAAVKSMLGQATQELLKGNLNSKMLKDELQQFVPRGVNEFVLRMLASSTNDSLAARDLAVSYFSNNKVESWKFNDAALKESTEQARENLRIFKKFMEEL